MSTFDTYASEKSFSDIVSMIYAAAGSPTRWRPVLENMTREFGGFGAQLNVFDPQKMAVVLSISHGCEWLTPARLRRYQELSATDPRVAYSMAHPGMPSHCRQAVSDEDLYASDIYKEILGPGDCEYAITLNTTIDGMMFYAGVLRHRAQRQFTHADVGRFSLFTPHIRRSIGLGLQLSQLDYSQQIASEAFAELKVGIALVSTNLDVLYANGAARDLLSRLGQPSEVQVLAEVLRPSLVATVVEAADAVAIGDGAPAVAPIDILGADGKRIRIRIAGIDDERARSLLGSLDRNCALLILEDANSDPETREERLARMFGLTAAEIRVAAGIADGRNPKILAREMDVSPETVRSQLKAVFRKTRTSSQTELVQLLGDLPIWPSLPPPNVYQVGLSNEV